MSKKKPEHIGIIPDGNRRWAVEKGMSKKEGYEYGLMPGLRLLQMAKEHGVKEITYYGFTVDNCKRPKEQFQAFQKACVDAVEMLTREGADFYVEDHLWPDYKDEDFTNALEWYSQQDVTLGG